MSDRLISLLDEHTVVAPIRKLSKGCTDLRVAVAFWGKGGTKTLSLSKAKKGRVLCNLESGACNPEEIRAIRASKTLQIRTHAQLHAKIYWSPKAAVIGSSNASTNGLVVDAKTAKGWREANMWIGDPVELKRIGLRFNELWKQGRRVTNNLLVDAEFEMGAVGQRKPKRFQSKVSHFWRHLPKHPVPLSVRKSTWRYTMQTLVAKRQPSKIK